MWLDTYGLFQRNLLDWSAVKTVRIILLPDHLGSKLILNICNQFIAIPFSHNTTVSCKVTTKLLSQQCSVRPTDRCVNRRSVIPPVCSAATFMNWPVVQSCRHPHIICNKRKMFSP
jgi:hypothetical protein